MKGLNLDGCSFFRAFRYETWSRSLGDWSANRVGQRRRGNAFVFGNPRDPIHQLLRRVAPLRAGSLLLWNQMTVRRVSPSVERVG